MFLIVDVVFIPHGLELRLLMWILNLQHLYILIIQCLSFGMLLLSGFIDDCGVLQFIAEEGMIYMPYWVGIYAFFFGLRTSTAICYKEKDKETS